MMIQADMALAIGTVAGFMFGYPLGFLVARMIYRKPNWRVNHEHIQKP